MSSNKKYVCSYVNNNTNYTRNIPQHLQRLMIEKYCKERNFIIKSEILEYNNMMHLPILSYVLSTKKFTDIIIFSIQSLCISKEFVDSFLKKTLNLKKNIYFANEGIELKSKKTIKIIKNLKF